VIETHYPYWLVFVLMMIGLYTVISHGNLVKKLIGLSMFQAGVFILYISLGKVIGGSAPVLEEGVDSYSHPLPHVLILTAIVVGVATTALGLALAVRIFDAYGTLEEDQMGDGDGDSDSDDWPDRAGPERGGPDGPDRDGELGVAP
jgi:multicomponent Na+:H+ antiporter subunit C